MPGLLKRRSALRLFGDPVSTAFFQILRNEVSRNGRQEKGWLSHSVPGKENFLTLFISLTVLWDKQPRLTDTEMEAQRWQSWFLSQSLLKMEPGINPGRAAPGSHLEQATEERMPLEDAVGPSWAARSFLTEPSEPALFLTLKALIYWISFQICPNKSNIHPLLHFYFPCSQIPKPTTI